MNKQEALDALELYHRNMEHILGPEDEKVKTIETCIQLVEEIPESNGGDTISRQAALNAMDTWDKFGCDPDGKLVRYDDDNHYVPYVHYDDMVHVIKHLPSAQPEGRKGVFIPDITVEMFRNASLESVEELMVSGEMKDIVIPPAQPGRYKWNPIKDGLPDEEGVYFVTDDAGGMATVYLDVFSHYEEDGSPYWLYSQNVTAWMHTPEPYAERRTDE